jgi:hypothetical protein
MIFVSGNYTTKQFSLNPSNTLYKLLKKNYPVVFIKTNKDIRSFIGHCKTFTPFCLCFVTLLLRYVAGTAALLTALRYRQRPGMGKVGWQRRRN